MKKLLVKNLKNENVTGTFDATGKNTIRAGIRIWMRNQSFVLKNVNILVMQVITEGRGSAGRQKVLPSTSILVKSIPPKYFLFDNILCTSKLI